MNQNFPRVLTLLRKEKGFSQKSVALSLGISQALLSHYEKGVRECGLDFIIKCADFYNVSCDYLLGRSAERTGSTISIDDIPDSDTTDNNKYMGFNMVTILNKKLISNSVTIIFDILSKCKNNHMVMEISYFIMLSIYRVFRMLHMSNSKNNQGMFIIPNVVCRDYTDACMKICEAKITSISTSKLLNHTHELSENEELITISTESLSNDYPAFASSLFNLIKNSESKIKDSITDFKEK
jgi:transcriptional regulator with XRE-family HTH domain